MIFKQWQQVLNGTKTQTRRVKKKRESLVQIDEHNPASKGIDAGSGTIKNRVGRSYPIIPKMYEKSVGRFFILNIQQERLQDITEADARAEGVASVAEYKALWESINGKTKGARWVDNPVVFVYTIQNATRPPDRRDMYDPINFN